jgi:hypothetical protein
MSLQVAIGTLGLAAKQTVVQKLDELSRYSGLGRQAVDNLYSEPRLPNDAWSDVIKAVLPAVLDASEISKAVCASLSGYTLKGPQIALHSSMIFGRAVSTSRFCDLLVAQGRCASMDTAYRTVRFLIGVPTHTLKLYLGSVDLGKYLLWSTFKPGSTRADPFSGMPLTAQAIRGLLGLSRDDNGPLLLFRYELPGGTVPRFPTVAEAYAGGGLSYFFRPAPPGAQYGTTMPWPEYALDAPRPEVVHEVISGANLAVELAEVS